MAEEREHFGFDLDVGNSREGSIAHNGVVAFDEFLEEGVDLLMLGRRHRTVVYARRTVIEVTYHL
jgi:hypothetical protein